MAQNLRRMRHKKGMSQEELAAQAGLYRTYVGHLEREVHSPTVDMLEKLAEILDVAPTDFFTDPPRQSRRRHRGNGKGPDPVDAIVGERLRNRRQSLGLSQRTLGETLGVTFQQIQKYERGMNRMAVATLVRAAAALDAPLSFFLDGIGPQRQDPERQSLHGRDARVAQALAGIEDKKVRAALRTLVLALSHEGHFR